MKTVAIIGLGARGYDTYAKYQHLFPNKMKIVAVADIDREKVLKAQNEFNIHNDMCFNSAEDLLSNEKLADVLFVTTQDDQHKNHAIIGMERGYDLLLEKPISNKLDDCIEIRRVANSLKKKVTVCHVLRYTEFYKTIKNSLNSGVIGDIVSIQAIENISYWHFAHSFVRGNWNNSSETSPSILQKCCHDFDILNWLIGKKCLRLSSFGSLKHFTEKNQPSGCSDYCCNCKVSKDCAYDAYKIYFDSEVGFNKGNVDWPINIVEPSPTSESLETKLKTSPYGRCVYKCNNNVFDSQIVNMEYEDNITVGFTMSAFTEKNARHIKIMGTKGEIVGDQVNNLVTVKPFIGEKIIYDINKIAKDLSGHGGGDNQMLTEMFDTLDTNEKTTSSIENSISSHIQAFAAYHSSMNDGELVDLKNFDENTVNGGKK